MKRIEAVIAPWTLRYIRGGSTSTRDFGVRAGRSVSLRLRIHWREGSEYQGLEFKADLSPRLRVEFVMFVDDVQATPYRLLELVHQESISVFRLDQEVRTIFRGEPSFEDLSFRRLGG